MHQQGILKTDDLITRFFRLCTEMCVDLCYRALGEQSHSPTLIRAKCFHTLDAFVRLIGLLVKHSGDTANTVTKINLLNKVSSASSVDQFHSQQLFLPQASCTPKDAAEMYCVSPCRCWASWLGFCCKTTK